MEGDEEFLTEDIIQAINGIVGLIFLTYEKVPTQEEKRAIIEGDAKKGDRELEIPEQFLQISPF